MVSTTDTIWQATFEAVAARNLGVAITPQRMGADKPMSFRSRLFEFTEAGMTVEFPPGPDARRTLRPDTIVELLVVHGPSRWQCRTTIEKFGFYKLNRMTSVHAIELGPALDVESAQRREFYRVTLTDVRTQPVQMMRIIEPRPDNDGPVGEELRGHDHREPVAFACQMINLSGGGMGAVAPQSAAREVQVDARYHCVLLLPNDPDPIELTGRVLHTRRQKDGTQYLGIEFEFENAADRRQSVDRLCKFTPQHQRAELQRLRETG